MALPPAAASLSLLVLGMISDGLAMTRSLVSISGYYSLHLFPERDQFDYTVSEMHRTSQAMHVIAMILMGVASLMMISTLFFAGTWSERVIRDFTMLSTATVVSSAAVYIVGVSTLLKVALDYKHIIDDYPIPSPDVKMELGSIMDIVGIASVITATILVLVTVIKSNREGAVRLS